MILKILKIEFLKDTVIIVDSGYQGIQIDHLNTLLPIKKSKNKPLTSDQKNYNKVISKVRVSVEHVFGWLNLKS